MSCTESWEQSVMEARKRFTVIITYSKSNKNKVVLQEMLKMLPFRPYAASIPAKVLFTLWISCLEIVEISWKSFLSSSRV